MKDFVKSCNREYTVTHAFNYEVANRNKMFVCLKYFSS